MNDHKADAFNLETYLIVSLIGSYLLGFELLNLVTLALGFAVVWKYDDPVRKRKEAL